MKEQLKYLAAKSDQTENNMWLPFWVHSMDTANVIRAFVQDILPAHTISCLGKDAEKTLVFLGMIQDIGMLTTGFQNRIRKDIDGYTEKLEQIGIIVNATGLYPNHTSHAMAGESILLHYHCPDGIAAIVGAHHGRPVMSFQNAEKNITTYPDNYYGKQKTLWEILWQDWIQESLAFAGMRSLKELPEWNITQQYLATAIIIAGDWIASNTEYFPLLETDDEIAEYGDRFDKGWEQCNYPKQKHTVIHVHHKNPVLIAEAQDTQERLAYIRNDVLQYMEQYGCNGFFYGTDTQRALRYTEPIIKQWVEVGNSGQIWQSREKGILMQNTFMGLADEALMAVLQRKHAMLRMLGLVGKVVIFDHVDMYDETMWAYLLRLLTWLGTYQTPVILLASILPEKKKEAILKAYTGRAIQISNTTGITYADGTCDIITGKTYIGAEEWETELCFTEYLKQRASSYNRIGVVTNTFEDAQKLYQIMKPVMQRHVILCDDTVEDIKEGNVLVIGSKTEMPYVNGKFDVVLTVPVSKCVLSRFYEMGTGHCILFKKEEREEKRYTSSSVFMIQKPEISKYSKRNTIHGIMDAFVKDKPSAICMMRNRS